MLDVHTESDLAGKIIFAGYAYSAYIFRLFLPVNLSVIYPFPKVITTQHYLGCLAGVLIILCGIIAYRKKEFILLGGICWYSVNIVLVLQFIRFGECLTADRYLYIASIGIMFPLVYYLDKWMQQVVIPVPMYVISILVAGTLMVLTYARNNIWLSDMNFYTAIINIFPNSAVGQYSIGVLYMKEGELESATEHIDKAVELEPDNYKAWYNKGLLELRKSQPAKALDALNRCLSISNYVKAYYSRAMIFSGTGEPQRALSDIDNVINQQPQNARALYIKATCLEQTGNLPDAINNYTLAIDNDSSDALYLVRRGLAFARLHEPTKAMIDLNTAIAMKPADGEAYYYRGLIAYKSGGNACDDFRHALMLGYRDASVAISKYCGQYYDTNK